MKSTAETILFAINAAIRLGRSAQQAYAKSLKSKQLVLPLPAFDASPSLSKAVAFFEDEDELTGGHQFLGSVLELKDLHTRKVDRRTTRPLTTQEEERYKEYYQQFSKLLLRDADDGTYDYPVSAQEFAALLHIRQFEQGEVPGSKPLQMVAGTIVTLGIDYFNQVPGALNKDSTTGQIMSRFLAGIDDLAFDDTDLLKKQAPKLIPQLFITAAETIGNLSDKVSADPKIQDFIQGASKGIAQDLLERMKSAADGDSEDETIQWGRMLLRSTISNAGHYVFEAPGRLLDLNRGATNLVSKTGIILLDAILTDSDQLDLKSAFSQHTMDRVMQSAFATIAEFPELVEGKDGFRQIVTGVCAALADKSIARPGYMPELLRLVLQHTAGNLQLIVPWNEAEVAFLGDFGDDGRTEGDAKPAPKFLLILALEELLSALSAPPSAPADSDTASPWRPRLSKSQLMQVANGVLGAVTANPAWVMPRQETGADGTAVSRKPLLSEVIAAVLAALERTPPAERFRTDLLIQLIEVGMVAVVRNEGVLNRLDWTSDAEEASVLEEVLSLSFAHIFHSGEVPVGERHQRIQDVLDYFVNTLLIKAEGAQAVVALKLMLAANAIPRLSAIGRAAATGASPSVGASAADVLLDTALDLLAAHPDLVTNSNALATIIGELTAGLDATDFRRPDLLSFLAQSVLHHSARNAQLILPAGDTGEPRYLLLLALRQLLETISRPGDEQWRLQLSVEELQWLAENMLDHLVEHPGWLLGPDQRPGGIWGEVLQSLHQGLRQLPKGARIQPETLRTVLLIGAEGAMRSPQLLEKVTVFDDATESVLLARIFENIVSRVLTSERIERARLDELLRFTFGAVVAKYPDERAIQLLDLVLFQSEFEPLSPWSDEQTRALVEAGVDVLARHPHLLTQRTLFKDLIAELGQNLTDAQLPLPQLLPELLRLSLRIAAENSSQLLRIPEGSPRSLLAAAIAQALTVLSPTVPTGTSGLTAPWRPRFSQTELVDLLKLILGQVNQNPAWVKDELISTVLEAIYASFDAIEGENPLPNATVHVLIEAALGAVNQRKQLVIDLGLAGRADDPDAEATGKLVLSYGLEGLFIKLYNEQDGEPAGWTLTQTDVLHAIIPYFLARLSAGSASRETVDDTLERVQSSIDRLNANLAWTVDELIEALAIFPTTA